MAKLDYKPAEKVAVAGLIVQLLAGCAGIVFYYLTGAATVRVFLWQAFVAVPIWLVALVHLRQRRLAEDEAAEWERLEAERRAGGARGALFEADEIQAFAARNRLRFMERVLMQIVAGILVLAIGGIVVGLVLTGIQGDREIVKERALLGLFSLLCVAFILFLIAKYASGMARQVTWRPLRAPASFMMLSTLFALLSFVALGFAVFGAMKLDRYLAMAMVVVLAVVGLETLINFVLDFYRPRVEGVEFRASFDSRLLGLLSEPGGILRTVADTLDYQFGFKISQTWFYQIVEQMVAPVLLFLVFVLYALSAVVIVDADERGVLERFGRYRCVVRPGLVWKWPWPVEKVYRFRANETKTFALGHAGERTVKEGIFWTRKHYETEYETLVAAKQAGEKGGIPVNLLVAAITVRYRIRDDDKSLYNWYYNCSESEKLLEGICSREHQKYFAGVDLIRLLGEDRGKAAEDLRARMQAAADEAHLGVDVLNVGLEEIHPPIGEGPGGATGLAESFQRRVEALEQMHVDVLKAEKDAIKAVSDAETEGQKMIYDAQGDYAEKVYREAGLADLFRTRAEVFQGPAEKVFRVRRLMDALEKNYGGTRKLIVGAQSVKQHLRLNLEDPKQVTIEEIPEFEKPIVPETPDKNKPLAK